jgi:hypothetical protein
MLGVLRLTTEKPRMELLQIALGWGSPRRWAGIRTTERKCNFKFELL